ncbi:Predicted arabinose efflux permease, MFS family [Actinacidiphila yanglinensis]|uniref:Predicted arabinose efflux permease, MFS family n=1 Tax=Actinacidiphila yanglinensis TaxID=310779 RepID=A0A1H6DGX4_9ACTN|nr:MFS transporter [Actinacidiphila yanglinensis]SEG84480.1 Predicted arabinose efflux permease, MFS family [Actinacidiphila yanglinensis]
MSRAPANPVPHDEQDRSGDFGKLLGSATVSITGDGMFLSSVALLAAHYTRDPAAISVVTAAGAVPIVVLGLPAGALVDRWDHRRTMAAVDAARFLVVVLMALLIATGHGSIGLIVAVAFLIAAGEAFYGTAAQSILPHLVSRSSPRLRRANSRLTATRILCKDFVGRPVGGALYAVAGWIPVLLNALSYATGSLLVAGIRQERHRPATGAPGPRSLRAEIGEGARWLWDHRVLRTLALLVAVDNLVFSAWIGLLVLLAQDRFHVSGVGFGVLSGCIGAGALCGSLLASRLGTRFGAARVMTAVMLLEGVATLLLGVVRQAVVAALLLAVVGCAAVTWNILTVSARQNIVPEHLAGRVNGAYRLLAGAAAPVGALIGGAVASFTGIPQVLLGGGVITVLLALVGMRVVDDAALRRTSDAGED